jgi:hypothetical protein
MVVSVAPEIILLAVLGVGLTAGPVAPVILVFRVLSVPLAAAVAVLSFNGKRLI